MKITFADTAFIITRWHRRRYAWRVGRMHWVRWHRFFCCFCMFC